MSLDAFFRPSSIAVVGASRRPGTFGHEILRNLKASYKGRLYAVNPKYEEVLGVKSYPSLTSLPEVPDLVVVAVRAEAAVGVVEEAGRAGARGVIVVSGGFAETGPQGERLEEELASVARRHGIRLVGPNCIGVYDPVSGVDTFFLPRERMPRPPRGYVSLVSQSGAFLTTLMEWAAMEGLGVYRAINIGNKADVDEADVIEYYTGDEATRAIGVYIEGVKPGAGPRLLDAIQGARDAGKHVVLLKGGRTRAGGRATMSHTASLAGDYRVFKDLVEEAGAAVVEDPIHLIDSLKILGMQGHRSPRGARVLVVTNAGGPGVIATDSLEAEGLQVPPPPQDVVERLRGKLPPIASLGNPIDLTGGATNRDYQVALEEALDSYDMALIVAPLQPATVDRELAWIIAEKLHKARKPGAAVTLGGDEGKEASSILESLGVPAYPFPHRAARALATLYKVHQPTCRGDDKVELPSKAARILDSQPPGKVPDMDALQVIEALGIPAAKSCLARSPEEAAECYKRLNTGRVVVKAAGRRIIHKTDVGGVVLGITSPEEAARAYKDLEARLQGAMEGALVQEMIQGGLEAIVGARKDQGFGPIALAGLGGVLVEVLRDYKITRAPAGMCRALKAVKGLKSRRILEGYRGLPDSVEHLAHVLSKASLLALHPRVEEVDLNPVILTSQGPVVVDARIILS
ncbi:MAG: acetate--CoA ligase family protein [Desulfurococcales archaeon]|nr:acetate--CoA ligase family protein [Desulfurococcales archaeon]